MESNSSYTPAMRNVIRMFLASLGLFGSSVLSFAGAPARTIPCKTPVTASSCRSIHGRLSLYQGTPSYRLWEIGTHHLFGILSGPGKLPELDNEGPQVPDDLKKLMPMDPTYISVYGDFEVCPLEREHEGKMQDACIESAKKLVQKKR